MWMKGSKGYYTGARRLLTKKPRERGKPRLGKLLIEYALGSRVIIKMDSSVQKSLPHKRFHGKIGTVLEKLGRGYVISITNGDAVKKIIVRSEHLEPYKGS
jgi:large subunit ribosomal protein L21e